MKLLKQLAIVALVCYGQSAIAMQRGWQAQIERQVDNMNENDVVARLQGLNGIIVAEDDLGDFRVLNAVTNQFLCFPKLYLTRILQLQAFAERNAGVLAQLIKFVVNNPNIPIPDPLIIHVIGTEYTLAPDTIAASQIIIRHIIMNHNYLFRTFHRG